MVWCNEILKILPKRIFTVIKFYERWTNSYSIFPLIREKQMLHKMTDSIESAFIYLFHIDIKNEITPNKNHFSIQNNDFAFKTSF